MNNLAPASLEEHQVVPWAQDLCFPFLLSVGWPLPCKKRVSKMNSAYSKKKRGGKEGEKTNRDL